MVSIDDIVKEAGVSKATVYRVLSRPEAVGEETRRKVLAAMDRLGRPVLQRPGRSRRKVALWVPGMLQLLREPSFVVVSEALESEGETRGIDVQVVTAAVPQDAAGAVGVIHGYKVKGVALMGVNDRHVRRALAELWPVVVIGDRVEDPGQVSVRADETCAAFLATEYLVNKGHERIAVAVGLGEHGDGFSQRFVGGWAAAMLKAGLRPSPELVLRNVTHVVRSTGPWREKIPPVVYYLKEISPPPTAVVGRVAVVSVLVHYLSREGVRIPEDLSVVGFGPRGYAEVMSPGMTLVSYNARDIAAAVLDAFEGNGRGMERGDVLLPVELHEGSTVASL